MVHAYICVYNVGGTAPVGTFGPPRPDNVYVALHTCVGYTHHASIPPEPATQPHEMMCACVTGSLSQLHSHIFIT